MKSTLSKLLLALVFTALLTQPAAAAPQETLGNVQAAIVNARAAAGERAGVSSQQVRVLRYNATWWYDQTTGCADGKTVDRNANPGFVIVVRAGSRQYTYNADEAGTVVTCLKSYNDGLQTIKKVKQNLAARLKVEATAIKLTSIETIWWRNSGLGCTEPGKGYLQVITPGYLIMVAYGGKTYEYHTGLNPTNAGYIKLCDGGKAVP